MKACGGCHQSRYSCTFDQVDKISHASADYQDGGNSRAIAPLGSLEGFGAHSRSEEPTRRTTIDQRESVIAAFVRQGRGRQGLRH